MKTRTRTSLTRGSILLACLLVACAVALTAPLGADAAGTASYVALGDSYTSSPLTGVSTSQLCFQSDNNYPHLVAAEIQPASFTDASCAGAVTKNMAEPQVIGLGTNPPQFDALTPTTTLVTVGIGGNDINLLNVIYECFSLDLLDDAGAACMDHYTAGGVNQLTQMINQTGPALAAVYQGIHARSPDARVLAVGYPAVLPVNGTGCWPLAPLSPGDVSFLAATIVALNQTIATVAAANDVQYVDTYTPTIGYDVCQAIGHAGFTALLPTSGLSFPLHPNALGERLMAGAVMNAINDPPPAPAPAPPPPPPPPKRTNPHLKVTGVTFTDKAVTVRGTINATFRGRVTVAVRSHYRRHLIRLHAAIVVVHGRWGTRLRLPRRYRGKLHTGTLTATSHRESGFAAVRVRASVTFTTAP